MSSSILPPLVGLAYPITRTAVWDTTVQANISGKEVRIANATTPRWKWELTFNILRSSPAYGEFQQLVGFFNARQGQFDTFLYSDADDNAVRGQAIGIGDGVTSTFQLVRALGGFVEPILAPGVVTAVYVDGVPLDPAGGGYWDYRLWSGNFAIEGGTSTGSPGLLGFGVGHVPAPGVVITADFTYYWPCRMDSDTNQYAMFMSQFYECKKFSFITVK